MHIIVRNQTQFINCSIIATIGLPLFAEAFDNSFNLIMHDDINTVCQMPNASRNPRGVLSSISR